MLAIFTVLAAVLAVLLAFVMIVLHPIHMELEFEQIQLNVYTAMRLRRTIVRRSPVRRHIVGRGIRWSPVWQRHPIWRGIWSSVWHVRRNVRRPVIWHWHSHIWRHWVDRHPVRGHWVGWHPVWRHRIGWHPVRRIGHRLIRLGQDRSLRHWSKWLDWLRFWCLHIRRWQIGGWTIRRWQVWRWDIGRWQIRRRNIR